MNEKEPSTKQLPTEPAVAYEAFKIYCELGVNRTQKQVARRLGKRRELIGKWSHTHDWKHRVLQHDIELVQIENDAREQATRKAELEAARERVKRREQVQDAAWEMFRSLREKARQMLNFPVGESESEPLPAERDYKKGEIIHRTIIKPGAWRFSDVARLADVADSLGRLATGMPSSVTGVSDPDGKPFTSPAAAPLEPPTVIVNIIRTKESDAESKLYGREPTDAEFAAGYDQDRA